MIVSHKYEFVYLAPPKTANRSLHSYLGQPAFVEPGTENRKGTMHVFEVPEEVRHYFTFASIRHPLDRTASLWAHSQTDISRKMQKTVTMGFEEFVLNFQFREGTLWFSTKSQTELLQNVRLDGVVRFDHLEEDLARLPPIARALKTERRSIHCPISARTSTRPGRICSARACDGWFCGIGARIWISMPGGKKDAFQSERRRSAA